MSATENTATQTVFRKFDDGDIIALFPSVRDGEYCLSYMRMGQHGGASFELVEELEPASPEEYAPLKRELESIGYILSIDS